MALQFLVFWLALPWAARSVIRHWQDWDGGADPIAEAAAEPLSADQPVAASQLLRSRVAFALSMGRCKRYRYAAEHLRECERLDARIVNWQGIDIHGERCGAAAGGFRPEVELLAAGGTLGLQQRFGKLAGEVVRLGRDDLIV